MANQSRFNVESVGLGNLPDQRRKEIAIVRMIAETRKLKSIRS
jgi:hypothetical protein